MLSAPVPRNLRVRSSIQIASARVPARAFLIAAGLIFAGGLMVVAGADVMKAVKITGLAVTISLVVFELRCWSRSMSDVAHILIRHVRRPHRLRLIALTIALPAEVSAVPSARRPRWQSGV